MPAAGKPAVDDDNKARVTKARKLLALRAEYVEKLAAIDEELLAVLGGGVTMADKVKQFELNYSAAWSGRYQGEYLFNFTKDVPNIKRLLKTFANAELAARALSYVKNNDLFFTRARHPFGTFVTTINQHAGEQLPVEAFELDADVPAIDCKHVPFCRTESEHTARRAADRKVLE